jgi:hypothetical protein
MDNTMEFARSNCVFQLVQAGLVVIEHAGEPEEFTIVRPASLNGTLFFEHGSSCSVGASGTALLTNAPPASLRQLKAGGDEWVVDISLAAAPGPGPVWFHQQFSRVEDAVEAIRQCYFGNRVDFQSEALWPQYRRPHV